MVLNIPVFLACDDNFAQHAGVAICSVLENKSEDVSVKIYILHSGLKRQNVAYFKNIVEKYSHAVLTLIHVGEQFSNSQELSKISKAMYYRLLIPEIVKDLDKAIYLDCDTVVIRCLSDLYKIDLQDNYVAAVQSPGGNKKRIAINKTSGEKVQFFYYLKNLGMKEEYIENYYINSGVLVFNCRKYRQDYLLYKMQKIIDGANYLFAPDQDVISTVTQDRKVILSLEWNFQTTLPHVKDSDTLKEWMAAHSSYYNDIVKYENELPAIVHYVYNKPWEPHDRKSQYDDLYWYYLQKTPWWSYKYKFFLKNLLSFPRKSIGLIKQAPSLLRGFLKKNIKVSHPRCYVLIRNAYIFLNFLLKGGWAFYTINYINCFCAKLFKPKWQRYVNDFFTSLPARRPRHLKRLFWLKKSMLQKDVADYFSGKSVAIIGNAKSLLESNYGKDIDGYDIVIRINRADIVNQNAQGSKTSVWATSFSYDFGYKNYDFCIWLTPFFHSDLCYPHQKMFATRNIYLYTYQDYCTLHQFLGSYPTSGLMLVDFITKYTCFNKLSLYGFDFFKTPNLYENIDYNRKHNLHEFNKEEAFVMGLMKKDTRISLFTAGKK